MPLPTKRTFFLTALFISILISGTAFAQQQLPTPAAVSTPTTATPTAAPTDLLTGNNGDAGDPNDNSITDATETTTPTQTVSASEKIASSPNAFGSTHAGRTAFTQMIRNIMPLSPAQIVTLRDMFDQSQRAVTQYPGTPPKPTSSSMLVNMSPGAAPPVIRLRAGYVTSMVFLDSTGEPWPVVGYDLGNPKAFSIEPSAPDGKSNTLIIQALERYQQGNLAVMLKDENTPVMLTLMPGQRAVDYRVDLRIPGLGPNAAVSMMGLPQAANPVLLNFLDGVAPEGAKELQVIGAPAQCWVFEGHLFLRTRVTILSPGWIASMGSPDGTHVYELAKTPVILASQRGSMLQMTIKGL